LGEDLRPLRDTLRAGVLRTLRALGDDLRPLRDPFLGPGLRPRRAGVLRALRAGVFAFLELLRDTLRTLRAGVFAFLELFFIDLR